MHFFRAGIFLSISLGLTVASGAKSREERTQQEMIAAIIKLADQAQDNFPGVVALQEAYKDTIKTVSVAPPQPALHANIYLISVNAESKRHFLSAVYQGTEAVQRAIAAVRALPAVGGAAWRLEGGPGEGNANWQIDIRRNGPVYANLTVKPAENIAFLSIGVFATPLTDTAAITQQVDDLIEAAKKDFEGTPRSPYLEQDVPEGSRHAAALMHSDEAWLYVTQQYYPMYSAKWYDATLGSGIIRDAIYARLDELVASGRARKATDTRDAAGGRDLFVLIGPVGVRCTADDSGGKKGTELQVGRAGEKPGWAASQRPRNYTPAADTYHSYSSSGSSASATHEHMCVRCDGRGKIDTSDAYGHYVHVTCPICGGSGRVSN